jgi:hypothetical protein
MCVFLHYAVVPHVCVVWCVRAVSAGVSTRKCSGYLHLLRLLQKLLKRSPCHSYVCAKLKAQDILVKLLRITQSDFRKYTLKLLKSLMRYINAGWRNAHMPVISAVFHAVRMDLVDPWLALDGVGENKGVYEGELAQLQV